MNYRIMTNVISITKQRYIKDTQKSVDTSLEKLASSSTVSNTEYDAHNPIQSEKLRAKICELQWTQRNANDGINTIQITRNGVNDLQNIFARLGANSGLTESDAAHLLGTIRSNLEILHHHLNTTIGNISIMIENLNAANSQMPKSVAKNDSVQTPDSPQPFCEHPHVS